MIEALFSSSQIEQQFQTILSDPSITIVSFDIFDTLLLRSVSTHEEVFEHCGKDGSVSAIFDTPETFARYRINAERSARRHAGEKEEIILEDIYNELPLDESQKKRFQEIELLQETALLMANPQTDRWIKMAYDAGKTVVLISDMYLSAEQIDRIGLQKLHNRHCISHIFISSECGCKKITGNLFLHIRTVLKSRFEEQFHIGDHPRSDEEIPKSFGIRTLAYRLDTSSIQALLHEKQYLPKPFDGGNHARLLAGLNNPFNDEQGRFYHDLGALFFAPVLWEFSHWLAQTAALRGIDHLFFLMREGDTFHRYFSRLYPQIFAKPLYVSRQSTYLASLDTDDLHSLNFHLYKALRLDELYRLYALPIRDPLIESHKERLCSEAKQIPMGSTTLMHRCIEDIQHRTDEIRVASVDQKNLLREYSADSGVDQCSALIDFGGGGTALSRLFSILTDSQKPQCGILLYQHAQGYANLVAHPIIPFLPLTRKTDKAVQAIARTYDFIEILLNATASTTQSYRRTEGGAEPILQRPACNTETLPDIIHAFRSGIDAFFSSAEMFSLPPKTFDRESLALILGRIIEFPTPTEAHILGELEYDEGKGSGHISTIVDARGIQSANEMGIDRLYRRHLNHPASQKHLFPWVQGTITRIDPHYLEPFFGQTSDPNRQTIEHLLRKIDISGSRSLMIYGAGELFKQLLPHLRERGIAIEALIDSRAETAPFSMEGFEVVSLQQALSGRDDAVIIVASAAFAQPICERIRAYCSQNALSVRFVSTVP